VRTFLCLAGIASLGLLGFLLVPRCYSRRSQNQSQLLWNGREVFACSGQATSGLRISRGGGIGCAFAWQMAAALPKRCLPDRVAKDLVVVTIAGDGLKQTVLRSFPTGGGCYVYDGALHYTVGVQDPADYPADWRWEHDRFVRLPKERALRQRDTYRYLSELHAATGWQEKQFWQPGEMVQLEIGGIEVRASLERAPGGTRFVLRRGREEATLAASDEDFHAVDSATYGQLPVVSESRRLPGPWIDHTPGASNTTE
jgi:hypothetical protein